MEIRRACLYLKIFVVFILGLASEYPLSGIYFRLVRHSDFLKVDWISAVSAIILCYGVFMELLKASWKEKVLFKFTVSCFLAACFLVSCFFRFSIQLANGLLDFSSPETRIVVVTDKNISVFGGSVKEGPNPEAHLIYFQDWDNPEETCELLTPTAFYYVVSSGSPVGLAVRRGFFHLPWVEDFQLIKSR
jgi:hypothetical protein